MFPACTAARPLALDNSTVNIDCRSSDPQSVFAQLQRFVVRLQRRHNPEKLLPVSLNSGTGVRPVSLNSGIPSGQWVRQHQQVVVLILYSL